MKHELIGSFANIWVRQKIFSNVGETIGGHYHKYDHLSILSKGTVKVEVDGEVKTFEAPTFIVIPKDKKHNVTALTDDVVWYCVFAHRDINGDVYDASMNVAYDTKSCASMDVKSISISTKENNTQ